MRTKYLYWLQKQKRREILWHVQDKNEKAAINSFQEFITQFGFQRASRAVTKESYNQYNILHFAITLELEEALKTFLEFSHPFW